MKAILVIDEMPTECIECPFHRIYADGFLNETYCSVMAKRNKDGVNTRADWCPLKPMPMKSVWKNDYSDGWNACLEELTGEQNGSI